MDLRQPTKLLAVLASLVIGSVVTVEAKEALSGSQIKKIMPGNYTLVVYGFDVGVSASPGGGLTVKAFGDQLKGRWSTKGNALCLSFKEGDKTQTECSPMTYDGKKWYTAAGLSFYAK